MVEPRVPVSPERTLVRANVFFTEGDFAKAKVIREKTDSMLFIARKERKTRSMVFELYATLYKIWFGLNFHYWTTYEE